MPEEVRTKVNPVEGLKQAAANADKWRQLSQNEGQPSRGIETADNHRSRHSRYSQNEGQPSRGIETYCIDAADNLH